MDLSLSGKVIELLPEQTGQGRNGPWRKREFILETSDNYPKKICVAQWGDLIEQQPVSSGDEISCKIDIQSNEYNGRWYTNIKAWRIDPLGAGEGPGAGPPDAFADDPGHTQTHRSGGSTTKPAASLDNLNVDDVDDDLPF